MRVVLLALAIGTCVTLALFGLGFLAAAGGLEKLSYFLYWQAWCLEYLVPCHSLAVDPEAVCQVTPWHVIAFYAGLPLGILLYSLLAYAGLSVFKPRGA